MWAENCFHLVGADSVHSSEKLSFLLCQSSQLCWFISVCLRINIWIFTSCLHYSLSTQLDIGVEGWWLFCTGWILYRDQHSQLFWFLRVLWSAVLSLFFIPVFVFFSFPLSICIVINEWSAWNYKLSGMYDCMILMLIQVFLVHRAHSLQILLLW